MLPVALRASILAHLLLLAGCTMRHPDPVAATAIAPGALEDARSWATTIAHDLHAYREDGLAKYEQPEIINVERDLDSVKDETDDALFIEEVNLLKKDWGTLAALDITLQQESVI